MTITPLPIWQDASDEERQRRFRDILDNVNARLDDAVFNYLVPIGSVGTGSGATSSVSHKVWSSVGRLRTEVEMAGGGYVVRGGFAHLVAAQ